MEKGEEKKARYGVDDHDSRRKQERERVKTKARLLPCDEFVKTKMQGAMPRFLLSRFLLKLNTQTTLALPLPFFLWFGVSSS